MGLFCQSRRAECRAVDWKHFVPKFGWCCNYSAWCLEPRLDVKTIVAKKRRFPGGLYENLDRYNGTGYMPLRFASCCLWEARNATLVRFTRRNLAVLREWRSNRTMYTRCTTGRPPCVREKKTKLSWTSYLALDLRSSRARLTCPAPSAWTMSSRCGCFGRPVTNLIPLELQKKNTRTLFPSKICSQKRGGSSAASADVIMLSPIVSTL